MSGAVFVFLLMAGMAVALLWAARRVYQGMMRWWRQQMPEPMPHPAPPQEIGPEGLVYLFADLFINQPSAISHQQSAVSNPKSEIRNPKSAIRRKELAQEMLLAAFAPLALKGKVRLSIVKKMPNPFTATSLRDWEIRLAFENGLPRTPLGCSLEAGYRKTKQTWFFKVSGQEEPTLEETIEFAVREMRRQLGRKRTGDVYQDIVRFVEEFLCQQGLLRREEKVGAMPWLSKTALLPCPERIEPLREQAHALKQELSRLASEEKEFLERLKESIKDALLAIKQVEGDREPIF